MVPGLDALHRMTGLLLAEGAPDDARILVLGAGGGLELRHLAATQPGWRFHGVDPSGPMLMAAEQHLGDLASRVRLQEGYVDDAPDGPYDGAVCLLTVHFLPEDERRRTLEELRRRLAPGRPLVVAHHSIPGGSAEREAWLGRFAAFGISSGVPAGNAEQGLRAVGTKLPVLTPEDDERLLREAGFRDVGLFYAAFTFRGWVASA
ncbi:methyltransferase [Patulibacter minatonensis]|uniref:methyltransferase n=1 Tax=Patulibacter minatonensis TaxID=298163 RepID=UPI000686C9F5